MPGGFSEPTLSTGDTGTYAFKVVTDANKVCAVKVELTSAMNASKFSNFDITVQSWTGGAWGAETLYAASTGGTTKASINGLTLGDAAYIHQDISLTKYYEIQVTYSYDKVNETSQIPVTFQFTPLPLDVFS
jgi:predicted peptidase